ncbi:hypothetical protein [Pontibacillus litoralis]|uniref:Uncharacterized protein n=1 Tax=Pontibacillus litoralis JSM 072002 TaxID=1385512 RepID=A0A0A5G6Z2_9BACI|nr:hypothetical protein [Pontibacillus litoralis]KGX86933.1 hypothetical protein N784_02960 [Pontibacillus litoralis JSM 072002]
MVNKKWNKVTQSFSMDVQEFDQSMHPERDGKQEVHSSDLELLAQYYNKNSTIPLDITKYQ